MKSSQKSRFKRVPAVDKCFEILDLVASSREPLGISEIAKKLALNKSTVFNIVHTLVDLQMLDAGNGGSLSCGLRMHLLGRAASSRTHLIRVIHPLLERISAASDFSVFLGVRFGMNAVIFDKVDPSLGIKVSSEVGMRLPLLAGAGGKALLSLLPDLAIDAILSENPLKRFTPNTIVDAREFKKAVLDVRLRGIAEDREEYIEGIVALSVPIHGQSKDLQAAIWAAGLKAQASDESLARLSELLKQAAVEVSARLSPV